MLLAHLTQVKLVHVVVAKFGENLQQQSHKGTRLANNQSRQ
jgi:hypothetical protein